MRERDRIWTLNLPCTFTFNVGPTFYIEVKPTFHTHLHSTLKTHSGEKVNLYTFHILQCRIYIEDTPWRTHIPNSLLILQLLLLRIVVAAVRLEVTVDLKTSS